MFDRRKSNKLSEIRKATTIHYWFAQFICKSFNFCHKQSTKTQEKIIILKTSEEMACALMQTNKSICISEDVLLEIISRL